MRKSIKKVAIIRVTAALLSILLFSLVTSGNIFRIQAIQKTDEQTSALLNRAQTAEAAHYRWASNLSNALYAGTEFTGSLDYTSCVLGQWLYGEAGTENQEILALRGEMEPLHRQLHQSASEVLEQLNTNPGRAQAYYQDTIQATLTTLVGKLDQVISISGDLSAESTAQIDRTLMYMNIVTGVCLLLALFCLLNLITYIFRRVVDPILQITESSRPLQEGRLALDISYSSEDELGDLAASLRQSMEQIRGYVMDINRVMGQLSQGDFTARTEQVFIGDFQSIQESMERFTVTLSGTLEQIVQAERRISGNAEQLSSSAQNLAQGATEQASAVEEMYATLDELNKSSKQNVELAGSAQVDARLTGEQVELSGRQMEQMVTAMADISEASQQIRNIIATIENIAFQTNILALNAAVEAARAGAAGKGFAVVADEVRRLASQSDQAAKATKDLIENSVQATERGSAIVDEVSATLQEVLTLVTRSNTSISAIAQAVEGESDAITQVTEGIGQISSVVQTNSASSEESAAVSTELFQQVRLLEDQTRRFRLRSNNVPLLP